MRLVWQFVHNDTAFFAEDELECVACMPMPLWIEVRITHTDTFKPEDTTALGPLA